MLLGKSNTTTKLWFLLTCVWIINYINTSTTSNNYFVVSFSLSPSAGIGRKRRTIFHYATTLSNDLNDITDESFDKDEDWINPEPDQHILEQQEPVQRPPPPAFTIIDDNDDSNDSSSSTEPKQNGIKNKKENKQSPPPPTVSDFSILDDDVDSTKLTSSSRNSDNYDYEELEKQENKKKKSIRRPLGPVRPTNNNKRKQIKIKKSMASTSWMEKNKQFTSQYGSPQLETEQQQQKPPKRNKLVDGSKMKPPPRRVNNNNKSEEQEGNDITNKTFRQDFRGTRVFVQGIPSDISWQELKDHFRVAGDVVFASVSIDSQTGISKGHGIVQFSTTEMAQTAIEIMRNHPLNGSSLYVREDVQETPNDTNLQLRSLPKQSGGRYGGRSSSTTIPAEWKCANDQNIDYLSNEERSKIESLINARDDARKRRNYDISDRLRDELKYNHGVFVDDRLKMWWTNIDDNNSGVPQTIQDIKGDGRWGNKQKQPWRQIPTTEENDACVNPQLIDALLTQRDIARREKDFSTADALLEEARTAPDGDLTLRIHDESRTWRIWTDAPPPSSILHRSNRNNEDMDDDDDDYDVPMSLKDKDPLEMRKAVARQCIEIVKEHAPDKLDEVKKVLKHFPGREFGVLKKLKKRYL